MEIEEAPHSPLLAVPAGPAGAAQEEHLLLQRKASAVGLHHTTFARFGVSVYLWSQNVRRLDVSLLLRRLWPPWPAGQGDAEKRGGGAANTIHSLRLHLCSADGPRLPGLPRLAGPLAQLVGLGPAKGRLPGPTLLRSASSRAQPAQQGQTTWSTALSGLDYPSDPTTRLSLFCYTASVVVTQTQTHQLSLLLTGLSTRGQAMLGHWSQHHLRL